MDEEHIEIPIEIREGSVYALMPDGTAHYLGSYEKAIRTYCGEFSDDGGQKAAS